MADGSECIFCRIVAGEIAADVVREDEHTVAFRDLDPKAPVHVLVIPRQHIASVSDAADADRDVMGALLLAARDVATAEGVADGGYRLVVNNGAAANQTVHHIHVHVMGGRDMRWPPG